MHLHKDNWQMEMQSDSDSKILHVNLFPQKTEDRIYNWIGCQTDGWSIYCKRVVELRSRSSKCSLE